MYALVKAIAWFCICLALIGGAGILLPRLFGWLPLVPPALALLLGAGVGMLAAGMELKEGGW